MKRTFPSPRAQPRDAYVTVITDLNGYVSFTFDHLAVNRHEALREVKARLLGGGPDVEHGVLCGRCGVLAWLELAENGMPLLVERDGAPHRDGCARAGELPLLALEKCREAAKRLAGEQQAIPAHLPADNPAGAFVNPATRECWNILQDGKVLLQRFEAMTTGRGAETDASASLSGATLEETWALCEATGVVEKRFAAMASDFFALLESLDKLHSRLHLTTKAPRAQTPREQEEHRS